VKGALIQIMPLTWESFLLPIMDSQPGSRSGWFHIGLQRGSSPRIECLRIKKLVLPGSRASSNPYAP
jgi:hypothetical protein